MMKKWGKRLLWEKMMTVEEVLRLQHEDNDIDTSIPLFGLLSSYLGTDDNESRVVGYYEEKESGYALFMAFCPDLKTFEPKYLFWPEEDVVLPQYNSRGIEKTMEWILRHFGNEHLAFYEHEFIFDR
jgi:hypothetical protein